MGTTTKVAKLLMIGLIIAAVGYGTERSVSAAGKFAPPENLTASSAQAGVVLTWAAPSGIEGVTGYRIVRKRPDDGETYVQVVVSDTGSTNTTWTDTNVNDGVRYKYGVKGLQGNQLGKRTALVAIVYDQPVTRPEAPTDLSIESADDGLVLTWVKPASGDEPTGYQILRRVPDGNMSVYVSDTGSTSTTWTDTDVSDGVLYKYRTKSLNVAGTSRRSNQVEMQWEAPEETDDATPPIGKQMTATMIWTPPFNNTDRLISGGVAIAGLDEDSDPETVDYTILFTVVNGDDERIAGCEHTGFDQQHEVTTVGDDKQAEWDLIMNGSCPQAPIHRRDKSSGVLKG